MKTYAPRSAFLPTSQEDLDRRRWQQIDIALITADAYVDHPSFGAALLGRLLESVGFRVGIIAQPAHNSTRDFLAMGTPRLCAMISGGNIDSMVSHYTANLKRRSSDEYSPGGTAGLRPDRATIVYTNLARQAYGREVPIIIGGIEASLRRLAHYDYHSDLVRRSILLDSKADLLVYGMGERQSLEIAQRLKEGESIRTMTDIPGTVYVTGKSESLPERRVTIPSFEAVSDRDKRSNTPTEAGKRAYAEAFSRHLREENPIKGRAVVQESDGRFVVQNPPAPVLDQKMFDALYELPFTLDAHPDYESEGGVPALREVQFSLTSNRGCFGSCSFCAIESHQGRMVISRSKASLVKEAERMAAHPAFKGYIHDLGGPTANFQGPSCLRQEEHGPCPAKLCLHPTPCSELIEHHDHYLDLIRGVEAVKGVKKVFVRSGLRYDYLLEVAPASTVQTFIAHLAANNVSGQLRVAPEHVSNNVLDAMGKPPIELYDEFQAIFEEESARAGKKQYLLPYFISAHPGCTLDDAIELALYLRRGHFIPDDVQDFYPTPGTSATCMYYTGLDPRPGRKFAPIHVPKGRERRLQRALLHHHKRENRPLVLEALEKANRKELAHLLVGRR
ncbi:MAG: YgiQ family radical SAM protein [Sphaerochaeta sp.]|nr:YgiQ family radical SAM protein [Sphaerochaeta sp.]